MKSLPQTHVTVRQARMLLIKVGLREEEADAFLDRLGDDFAAGRLEDQVARLKFIEHELADVRETQRKAPGRIEGVITGIVTGAISSGLYELAKSQISIPKKEPALNTEEAWRKAIQIDWACSKLPDGFSQIEQGMRIALRRSESARGAFDARTAIFLDALALSLSARGEHGQAVRLRRQAVKVSQRVNGPADESTGAAYSNCGLSLFAQGRYRESDEFLAKGFRILLGSVGQQHLTTSAAIFNLYFCWHAQGRLVNVALPTEFTQALPRIREAARSMMARKMVLVGLLQLEEIVEDMKDALGSGT